MSSGKMPTLDRRAFLAALGLVPAAAWVASCGTDDPQPLKSVDMAGSDAQIRPQDDLYRHVNGTWLREYQMPPDKTSFGAFHEARERTQEQLREIIEGISDPEAGSGKQKIRDLYDARMNLDQIEKLGLTPIESLFADIDGAATKPELARVMGALPIGGLIGLGVDMDRSNSEAYIPIVTQSGIALSEQYYRLPQYAEQVAGYRTYLESLATAAGFADPAGLAQRELDLETRIAAGHWDNVRSRDVDATNNRLSWADMVALAPEFDWDPWLSGITDRPEGLFGTLEVYQPSFITEAGRIWVDTDIAMWRDYLKLAVLRQFAENLPKQFSDASFEFSKIMSGVEKRPELWKSAVGTVNSALGEELGQLYVREHFPPEAKERALEMVDDLLAAYRDNFTQSSWMSPETGKAAIAKLDKIDTKIGYPDTWRDYSKLTITRDKLIESLLAANTFAVQREFNKLGEPVDKGEWAMSPQTVNAYYMASTNTIAFPAAFLQPPFFDKDAKLAVNFGGVGAVIGHEIGHGFDDQGAKFDGDGNRRDWWTDQDREAFEAKTQQIIDQYDVLVPEGLAPEHHVDGELTVGENLADLRGLQIALAAYRIAAEREGIEPDYRSMFLSWARVWRSKRREETMMRLLATDPHSPAEFRCNQVVRNIAEFYRSFNVTKSDDLFLPEDQRVTM